MAEQMLVQVLQHQCLLSTSMPPHMAVQAQLVPQSERELSPLMLLIPNKRRLLSSAVPITSTELSSSVALVARYADLTGDSAWLSANPYSLLDDKIDQEIAGSMRLPQMKTVRSFCGRYISSSWRRFV
jgi:hypothetical protein